MKELFDQIVMRLALCGLAASFAVLALRSWPVRAAVARLSAIWRGLTAFGRFAVCAFLLVGVLEADKTNNVNSLPPQQQMMAGGWVSRTGFTGLTGFVGSLPHTPSSLNPVNPVNPVQNNIPVQTTPPRQTFASRWAANWNIRGAWKDSFWLSFEDGWVFPHGTNHLSGVEVVSQGMVWSTPFDANAVASIGEPVEIVPGLSSFGYELTPSNSYRFVWTDAAINRDTNNLVSASIELFRNGDIVITTNGAAAILPRELPFPHSGFGQDDEWVTANFTNATEILAQGYTNWVASATLSETNGVFSFAVAFSQVPPEAIQLEIGDFSVTVTNAGEYVFCLEKGVRHRIRLSYLADGVMFAFNGGVHDSVVLMRGAIGSSVYCLRIIATGDDGHGCEIVEPTASEDGYVLCWPWLSIVPGELTNPSFPILFHADVFGIPDGAIPSVTWEAGEEIVADGENLVLSGEEDLESLSVTATYRDVELHGSIYFDRHVASSDISLLGGGLIVVEDSYTNSPGDVVAGSSTSAGLHLAWALCEGGTLCLDSDCAGVVVTNEYGTTISLPHSWHGYEDEVSEWPLLASFPGSSSQTGNVGSFTFTFTPDSGGSVLSRTVALQVAKVRVEAAADWPSNKVRHVFGPKEQFSIQTNPYMSLSVRPDSHASVSGSSVTAPDRNGEFTVALTSAAGSHSLVFNCIAPTALQGGNPRELYANEWHTLIGQPLSDGESGVVMHFDSWLEPAYVSFRHVRLYEGFAPTSNRTGWFLDLEAFPEELLRHGEEAGMGSGESNRNVGIREIGNFTDNGDYAGMWIGERNSYSNGSYQLSIPLKWFVEGGSVTNSLPNSVQTVWVYTNGTMRVQKNGVTWERSLDGNSHQIVE